MRVSLISQKTDAGSFIVGVDYTSFLGTTWFCVMLGWWEIGVEVERRRRPDEGP